MRPTLTALVLALVVAVGWGLAGAASAAPGRVDPSIANGSAKRALDRARARWRAAAIASYSFEVRVTCFCPPSGFRRLVVVRGRPRNPPPRLARVATVPRLFSRIASAIERRSAGLVVLYGRRGVPTAISIDPAANVADDETNYTIRRFQRG